jgi:hypothetical protein
MSDASFPHCKLCRQPNYACVCVDDDFCAMDIDDEILVSATARQPVNVISLDHERSRRQQLPDTDEPLLKPQRA